MKKWIIFLVTIGITLYFIIMYESPETYRLLTAEIIWFVLSLCQLWYGRMNVKVRFLDSTRVVNKGADIPISIHLENQGALPMPFAEVHVNVDGKKSSDLFTCSLKGREKRSETLYIRAERAGLCRIEIGKVIYYDFLHIFGGTNKVAEAISVFILPCIYPVAMEIRSAFRYFGDDSELYYEDGEGNDPSEILEIREYRAGDRLQKIHWKLSQRTDTLMVKEYSEPIGFAVVFLLDTSRFYEAYLETFMSICMEMCYQKCLHYICFMDDGGVLTRKPITREENLYSFLQSLMRIDKGYQNFDEDIYNDWYGQGSYHTCLRLTEKLELYKQGERIGQIVEQDVEKSLAEIMVML